MWTYFILFRDSCGGVGITVPVLSPEACWYICVLGVLIMSLYMCVRGGRIYVVYNYPEQHETQSGSLRFSQFPVVD